MRGSGITKETLIRRETRHDGEYTYSYDLIMSESDRQASFRINLYTIRITLGDNNGDCTDAEVRDAFADFGRAVLFYEKLVRNLCTPLNLRYILEDEIAK